MSASATSALNIRVGISGVQAVSSQLKSLAGGVKGLFGHITADVNLSAIKERIMQVVELGTEFQNLKNRTGASISALVAMDKVFKRIGSSASENANTISKMQRTIAEAVEGSPAQAKTLGVLGLDPAELSKLSADQQFLKLGEALNGIGNDAQRAQVSMELFGKSGATMLQVFRDPHAMEILQAGGGNFGTVIARNAEVWHEFAIELKQLSGIPKKFFAGVMDMLPFEEMNGALNKLLKFDFTAIGQNVGAWVSLVIDYWKMGRVDEIIGLTIQAGFEQGKRGLSFLWDQLKELFSAGHFALLAVEISSEIAKALAKGFVSAVGGFADGLLNLVQWLGEKIADLLYAPLNKFILWYDRNIGVKPGMKMLEPLSLETDKAKAATTYGELHGIVKEITGTMKDAVDLTYNDGIAAAKKLFANESPAAAAATDALMKLIEETKARIAATKPAEKPSPQGDFSKSVSKISDLSEIERQAKLRLMDLDRQRAAIEADFTKTNAEKWELRKKNLQDERDTLKQIVDLLTQRAAMPGLSEQERQQVLGRADHFQGQLGRTEDSLGKLGADPNSFRDQWSKTMTDLQNEFGTWAQQTSKAFADVFNGAISSISNGITGLIMGTMTWGQALQQIGSSIIQSIIQSIVQMGVRWVMNQVMMATMGKAILAASAAATAPIALAQSAIWAAPATLATIASFGGAAASAPFEILMAQMATLATIGFAEGGYTGSGGKFDMAGIVHRGEFVMPQETVNRVGLGTLEAIKDGGEVSGMAAPNVKVVMVSDMKQAALEAMKSPAGERVVIRHAQNNRLSMGVET